MPGSVHHYGAMCRGWLRARYERIVLAISYAGATSLRQFSEIGMTGWTRLAEQIRASLALAKA